MPFTTQFHVCVCVCVRACLGGGASAVWAAFFVVHYPCRQSSSSREERGRERDREREREIERERETIKKNIENVIVKE